MTTLDLSGISQPRGAGTPLARRRRPEDASHLAMLIPALSFPSGLELVEIPWGLKRGHETRSIGHQADIALPGFGERMEDCTTQRGKCVLERRVML